MATEHLAFDTTDESEFCLRALGFMETFIEADQVSVTLADSVLLAPTSFTLNVGEALVISGANGSGKTTLLRVLAGLTKPSAGRVRIANATADQRRPEFRAMVAALIQTPPLARNLTLREHLIMVSISWGCGLNAAEHKADELFAAFEMPHLVARFPHELSTGQSQLFNLALTLARPFDVLLLDEPEQRLDAHRLSLVQQVVRARVAAGATLVMATHSSELAAGVADQEIWFGDDDN